MQVDFKLFRQIRVNAEQIDPEDLAYNRHLLTDGVCGVKCVEAGRIDLLTPDQAGEAQSMLEEIIINGNIFQGSVEIYENGAVNIFVRRHGLGHAIGVIRLRKE